MRTIPNEFAARLASGATKLCRCWTIERKDGVVFGFTDHDQELVIGGVSYQAGSGLDAGALQSSTGASVDNSQVTGALSAACITEVDLHSGKYDRARVDCWLVDWERPDLRLLLFRGTFGEIKQSDGKFDVDLRGLSEDLNVPVGRTILRTCDRVLGDGKCRVDLEDPAYSCEVAVGDWFAGAKIECAGLQSFDVDWFKQGHVVWLTGRNVGSTQAIRSDIRRSDGGRVLELWRNPPFTPERGERFRVVAGCDKRPETCRSKFSNFYNFRGFPHLPGEDWVAAYPKDGEVHDGSSLKAG
jgi:uncharacterized phage protein (TIGR02218 family)